MNRWYALASLTLAVGAGCSDEGEDDGAGGGASTTASSSSSSSSSSAGGNGQGGGAQGGGGQGGQGGGADPCDGLAAGDFTITDKDLLCVVARYEAEVSLAPYGASPTWGRHGGLLTVEGTATGGTLSRWSIDGTNLEATTSSVVIAGLPADAFVAPIALDLPGTEGTLLSWSGADFENDGEIVLSRASDVLAYGATGVFGMGIAPGATGRVLYTGLSGIGAPTNATVALYGSDLLAGPTLEDSTELDEWGLAAGPLAVDADGNALAVATDYVEGTQELRLYEAADVAAGGAAVAGVPLTIAEGYGDTLAALGAAGASPALAFWQRNATAGAHLDVEYVSYVAGAAAADPLPTPTVILELVEADVNVTLTTDDQDRLWVGVPNGTSATFYVLARPE